ALEHDLGTRLLPRQRRLDAGSVLGLSKIDRHDARMWMRRSDDLAVDHPGTDYVEGVLRAPGDFVRSIEPLDGCPNHRRLLGPRVLLDQIGGLSWYRTRCGVASGRLRASHGPPPSPWPLLP